MVKIKLKSPIPLDFTQKKQGFMALLAGIIVALILGILASVLTWGSGWVWWPLAIGLVVGILNIFHDEGILFVIALLTLTLMLGLLVTIAPFPAWIASSFDAMVYVLAPVATLVSLKVLYALAVK